MHMPELLEKGGLKDVARALEDDHADGDASSPAVRVTTDGDNDLKLTSRIKGPPFDTFMSRRLPSKAEERSYLPFLRIPLQPFDPFYVTVHRQR